jgi:hypothetical protein
LSTAARTLIAADLFGLNYYNRSSEISRCIGRVQTENRIIQAKLCGNFLNCTAAAEDDKVNSTPESGRILS